LQINPTTRIDKLANHQRPSTSNKKLKKKNTNTINDNEIQTTDPPGAEEREHLTLCPTLPTEEFSCELSTSIDNFCAMLEEEKIEEDELEEAELEESDDLEEEDLEEDELEEEEKLEKDELEEAKFEEDELEEAEPEESDELEEEELEED